MGLSLTYQEKEEYSDKYKAGMVISTTPAAGEYLRKGNTVLLVISKGPENITVPSFLEMTIEDAALKAEGMGLKVEPHKTAYSAKPAGTVIGQSLDATTEVKQGASIVFTVSQGPEPIPTVNYSYSYSIPDKDEYNGVVRVEFRQNNSIVGSREVDTTVSREDTFTFTGDKGTTATIVIYINGNQEISERITF